MTVEFNPGRKLEVDLWQIAELIKKGCNDEDLISYGFGLDIIEKSRQIPNAQIQESKEGMAQAYKDIISLLNEWVDIPEEYKKIISIWIIGTYFHKSFSTYPYLFLNAAKGSGKTRLLQLISWLQYNGNGIVLNNPSEPVMFRTAEERGLIFDEFESEKSKDKQTMREYLNSCYKKGGVVFRMEKQRVENKEKQVAVGYPLFTPVAMANINGIEDVLADRSISLIIEKSMNPGLVKKIEDFDTNPEIKRIKANLSRFSVHLCSVYLLPECRVGWNAYINVKYTPLHTTHTLHNYTQLYTDSTCNKSKENDMFEFYERVDETGIFGRNLELFFPLLMTSKLIEDLIFSEILDIVKVLNVRKKEDEFTESKDASLIEFVSEQEGRRFTYVYVYELLSEFKNFIGSRGEEEDKWITTNWFGSALKRMKLVSDRKRVAKGVKVLLNIDNAKDKLKIYKEVETK